MKTRSRLGTLTPVVVAVTIAGAAGCGGENKAPDTGTAAVPPGAGATTVATTRPGSAAPRRCRDRCRRGRRRKWRRSVTASSTAKPRVGCASLVTAWTPREPLSRRRCLPTKWITGDGSYTFIQQRVSEGVPEPTPPYPGPMLPMGGAQLTPAQIKAVAAYVYSISRG